MTPLQLATELNRTDFVLELLDTYKCDVNKSIHSTLTPLQLAVRNSNLDLVRKFLRVGANVNTQDLLNGRTALHWSVETKNYDIVAELLDAGAMLFIKDKLNGETPLHLCVRECHNRKDLMLLCLLLDADEKMPAEFRAIDVQRTTSLETCLHLAVMESKERAGVVQLLLQYKPNLDLENAEGETVQDLAEKKNFVKSLSVLQKARRSQEIAELEESVSIDMLKARSLERQYSH